MSTQSEGCGKRAFGEMAMGDDAAGADAAGGGDEVQRVGVAGGHAQGALAVPLLLGMGADVRLEHLYPCLDARSLASVLGVCRELRADAR